MIEGWQEPTQPFVRHIWNMLHHYNYNWLQVITGNPGTGKSYTAMTLGEMLDPNFSIDKVAFSAKEFIDILNNIKRNGEVVVWDEVGISASLSSRRWFTLSNILIDDVIQTFRYRKICVFLVVPDLSFIDVRARKLVRCFSECKRRQKDPAKLWVYWISVNRRDGKIYTPHPLIQIDGATCKLRAFVMKRLPSEQLMEDYERVHKKYKARLEMRANRIIGMMERKEFVAGKTIYDFVGDVEKDREKYTNKKGVLDWYLIKMHLKISEGKAKQIQKYLEKKE